KQMWCVVFSPDGKHFAAAGAGGVQTWSVLPPTSSRGAGAKVSLYPEQRLSEQRVRSLSYSPDGRLLAWVDFQGNTLHVRDQVQGRERSPVPTRMGGSTNCIAFTGAGEQLVLFGAAGQPELWDLASGQCLAALSEGEIISRLNIVPSWK